MLRPHADTCSVQHDCFKLRDAQPGLIIAAALVRVTCDCVMSDPKRAPDAVDDPPTPDAQDAQRPAISELDAACPDDQVAVSSVDRDAAVKALYFIMQSVEVMTLFAAATPPRHPFPLSHLWTSARNKAAAQSQQRHTAGYRAPFSVERRLSIAALDTASPG